MAKEISYDNETRQKMAAGVAKLADAVRVTLGPRGRYVAMTKKGERHPNLTNDGAMVASHVSEEDRTARAGLEVVRQAAIAANNEAGDGTSTATVLADAIVREGVRYVAAGSDPLALRRGIQAAADAVAEELLAGAQQVTTRDQMAEIATVSSGDAEIGGLIADALEEIGLDGVISVEKSNSFGLSLDVKRGMLFDRGFISPYMADDMGKMTGELHQPYILITDQRLADNFRDVVPVLEEVIDSGHPVLIVADDVRGESLNALLTNRERGVLTSVAVTAPGAEERRKAELEDMAILTGGEVITPDRGLALTDARKSMLGRAQDVQITKDRTLIIGGKGKADAVEARCEAIRAELAKPHSEYDAGVLRERLAKLTGGIAVLSVGAATETEMNEIRSRIQDAIRATRSAAEQGLLAGGGVALVQASRVIDGLDLAGAGEAAGCSEAAAAGAAGADGDAAGAASADGELASGSAGGNASGVAGATATSDDVRHGAEILRRALEEPLRALCANAGYDGNVEVERARAAEPGCGLNCETGERGNMIAMGVADPAKVTVTALQAAASVASLILITECAVVEAADSEDAGE